MQAGGWQGRAVCHRLKINDRGAHTKAREGQMWRMANQPAKIRSRTKVRQGEVRAEMTWVWKHRPNSESERGSDGKAALGFEVDKASQWEAKEGQRETKSCLEMRVSCSWMQATCRQASVEACWTRYTSYLESSWLWNCSWLFSWAQRWMIHFWNPGRPLSH